MSNSVVTLSSFNILFFTQVLTVLTSTIKYNEYVTDKGENISIPCIADGNIMWVKENGSNNSTIIQTGKYLVLTNVSASDKGLYVCFAAVTSSRSLDSDESQSDSNTTALSDEKAENDKQNDDERDKQEVLLTSTTKTNQHNVTNNNDTFLKPLVENKNIQYQITNATTEKTNTTATETKTKTQNALTTSMLPMPNITTATTTATTANTTSNSPITVSASASATATASTTTTTTIIIKTITNHTSTSASISNTTTSNISSNRSSSSSSTSSSSDLNLNTFTPTIATVSTSIMDDIEEQEFQAFQKINLTVRTPPGPVTKLYFKASTILGFLIWRFNKTNSGGYPVRSFTAEFRNVSYVKPPFNSSFEHKWSRMDPINIAPNVRQMEVYRLEPNTTYEFRIWANNQLGSGEVVTTNVTTLPETKEEDLIRLIQPDLDNFDPRIWIVAVSIVLGTFVILAIGLCIVLTRECYQSSQAGTETNSICIANQNQTISYFNNRPSSSYNNNHHNSSSDVTNNVIVITAADNDNDVIDDANNHHNHRNHHRQHHIIVDVVDA